jgi:tetratricopeptide (TPR) repeat protein
MQTSFKEVLNWYIGRQVLSVPQLAKLANIPEPTLVKWVDGQTEKPRHWQRLARLAKELRLSESEASELLKSARHPSIQELRDAVTNEEDKRLLLPWHVPSPPLWIKEELKNFVGREAILAIIERHLERGDTKIFRIQGMPGVGKTALVAQVARLLKRFFPDGVLGATLSGEELMSVLFDFAFKLGHDVSGYRNLETRASEVKQLLSTKKMLVVLDDLHEEEAARHLLPASDDRFVLMVTSRSQTQWVTREAFEITMPEFDEHEALELFAKILGPAQVEEEREALLDLAAYLGFLPIAIDIAAQQIKDEESWIAKTFLEDLKNATDPFADLEFGELRLQALFELSFSRLNRSQQQFFASLGAFSGGDFGAEAAAAIAETAVQDAKRFLRELRRRSLLRQVGPSRFQLHNLLRLFAYKKLDNPEHTESCLADHYGALAQQHAHDFPTLEVEKGNIESALQLATKNDFRAALIKGTNGMFHFWTVRGRYDLLGEYLEKARAAAEELGDRVALLETILNIGQLAGRTGDSHKEAEFLGEGLILAEGLNRPELIVKASGSLAAMAFRRADYSQAKIYFDRCLSAAEKYNMIGAINTTVMMLGQVEGRLGNFGVADDYARRAIRAFRLPGQEHRLCWAIVNWGGLAFFQKDYNAAEARFQEALDLAQKHRFLELSCGVKLNLGMVHLDRGNLAQAKGRFDESLLEALELKQPDLIAEARYGLGMLSLQQNQLADAERYFHEAIETARQYPFREIEAQALFGLAKTAAAMYQNEEACDYGRNSLILHETMGHFQADEIRAWLDSQGCNDLSLESG